MWRIELFVQLLGKKSFKAEANNPSMKNLKKKERKVIIYRNNLTYRDSRENAFGGRGQFSPVFIVRGI